jgi:hypothetical protein
MAAPGAPASLVHPDALDAVFDIVDVNGDGELTVNAFITVRLRCARPRRGPREISRNQPDVTNARDEL